MTYLSNIASRLILAGIHKKNKAMSLDKTLPRTYLMVTKLKVTKLAVGVLPPSLWQNGFHDIPVLDNLAVLDSE
ncbi:hypothetical protein SHAQ108633_18260 [Shewanella aquimarina]